MELILNGFYSFKWRKKQNIHIIGFPSCTDASIVSIVDSCQNIEQFADSLKKVRGNYSVIVEKDDETWACVDRARSFPLFYSCDGCYLSDRADDIHISMTKAGKQPSIDMVSLAEMVASRNTKNNKTVFNEIKQIDIAEVCCFGADIKSVKYYFHYRETNYVLDEKARKELFGKVIKEVFSELIEDINDKKIVVPLSGGYDSRFLLSVLKAKGVNGVICYTYGRYDDYDVQTSKTVATTLGYEWHFVPYTRQEWDKFWYSNNELRNEYFEYTHNHANVPHIQDFIALKKLKDDGVIDENCVILPGFCADLPAGSFVNPNVTNCDRLSLAGELYDACYTNVSVNENYKKQMLQNIQSTLIEYSSDETYSKDEHAHLFNCWFTNDRPSRWVVNSVRVYEIFGCEWRLPFWDDRFLDFFYSMPTEELINCKFYIDYIFENYFVPLNIAIEKPQSGNLQSNQRKNSFSGTIKEFVKHKMIDFSYFTGIFIYNRNGTNNYNYACRCIYQLLKKSGIRYGKYGGVHQIEMVWWCANKYGNEKLLKIISKGKK